jgi:hypothetical protein
MRAFFVCGEAPLVLPSNDLLIDLWAGLARAFIARIDEPCHSTAVSPGVKSP